MRVSILATLAIIAAAVIGGVDAKQHKQKTVQYSEAALADQITSLPGLAVPPTFNQFSGYLVVDDNPAVNRSIHYWYVESQNAPETDPLLWWSNGGPGCSGLIGFLTEHGPFRTTTDGGLAPYEYAWNKLANVLYVEAPAGVGFSFSLDVNDYNANDASTASDNYLAIQQFFLRFPHLQSNDFYLSAESYGGHYVPQLAALVVQDNQLSNFRGFMLGNPLTDPVENAVFGAGATMCGHSLASKPTCDLMTQHCITNGQDDECEDVLNQVQAEAGNPQNSFAPTTIDPYGLDYPICSTAQPLARLAAKRQVERRAMMTFRYPHLKAQLETRRLAQLAAQKKRDAKKRAKSPITAQDNDFDNDMPYDPCGINEETTYLTRTDVLEALHISPHAYTWAACQSTPNLNYNRTEWNNYQEPLYTQILAANKNLRLVIYSGDDDSICGTLGTQSWIYPMFGNGTTSSWTQWMYNNAQYGSQIGGSIVQFTGISFVTVHSAGHMVPQYQPERGLAVLSNFLDGTFTTTSQKVVAKKSHGKKHHA